ncbi:hypothetical protein DMN91_002777 [Ooceraea biroi]|uniref:Uncharacterized protein n=1 Tax=Ooceraea biroi TaxID=2015173 RepID=A0A3L8DXZ5_OOCBI|nr:hypothetical protein DMN91_002777 [Ooceraea biroi]
MMVERVEDHLFMYRRPVYRVFQYLETEGSNEFVNEKRALLRIRFSSCFTLLDVPLATALVTLLKFSALLYIVNRDTPSSATIKLSSG